jgi:glycosyltransferase involved in cell wall biosynthesis/SAM-dependent methyltransferase
LNTAAVVITTFNHARYLDEALRSVIAQTIAPGAVIVVDDGSTDDPATVVARYPLARLIRTENRGLSAARNIGLQAVETRFVVFLDADDRLRPGALAFGLDAHRASPGAAFVYGAHRRTDADGRPIGRINYSPVLTEPFGGLLRGNRVGMHACAMYSVDAIRAAGAFDEALPRCEDYELFLRIAEHAAIASHPELVAEYRIHDTNMSADHRAMLTAALAVQARYRGRGERTDAAFREGRARWRSYYGEQAFRSANDIIGIAGAVSLAPSWAIRQAASVLSKRAANALNRAAFRLARFAGLQISPPVGAVCFGDFAAPTPISTDFGWGRGKPIDRFYIEDFLRRNADAITGHVLEVGNDAYSKEFGGQRVALQDVLHVKAGAPGATIIGDVSVAGTLPERSFDCIIFTQTLHLIFHLCAVIDQLHAALRPGGVLLLTTPGITPLDRGEWADRWFWSLTPASLAGLLSSRFDPGATTIETHGNVFSATAFLQGVCCEDIDISQLLPNDNAYPVVVAARAERRL